MGDMTMRVSFVYVVTWTFALGVFAAHGQSVKPKYPGEITKASAHISERNENCRRQAREQHLHLLSRYRFMRDCKRQ
jgi:hypothetical protein